MYGVHTGSDALQLNQLVGAQAFTHGSNIYFGAGHSPTNLNLTAHELIAVVQQTGAVPLQTKKREEAGAPPDPEPSIQRICDSCPADDRQEKGSESISRQAESAAHASPSVSEGAAEPAGDGVGQRVQDLVLDARLMLEVAATGRASCKLDDRGFRGAGRQEPAARRRHRRRPAARRGLSAGIHAQRPRWRDHALSGRGRRHAASGRSRGPGRPDDPCARRDETRARRGRAACGDARPCYTAACCRASSCRASSCPAASGDARPRRHRTARHATGRGLAQLVAVTRNPEVDADSRRAERSLEKKFMGLKRSSKNEEVGEGRNELVVGLLLHTRIAGFDKAGLDPRWPPPSSPASTAR